MPDVTADMVVQQMQRMLGGDWTYRFGAEVGNYPNTDLTKKIDCSEATESAVRWAAESVGSRVRLTDGSFAQHDACYNAGTLIPIAQARKTPGALVFLSRVADVKPGMGRNGVYHVGLVGQGEWVLEACCSNGDVIKPIKFDARHWYHRGGLIPGIVYPEPPPVQPPVVTPPPATTFTLAFQGGGSMTLRVVKNGVKGTDAKSYQRLLGDRGFSPGAADGVFGPKSVAATKNFQKAKGLTADGIIGANTAERLIEG